MLVVLIASIPIFLHWNFRLSLRSFLSGGAVSISSLFYLTSIETLSVSFSLTIVFGLPALFSLLVLSAGNQRIRILCAFLITLSFLCLARVSGVSSANVSSEGVLLAIAAGVLIFLFGFLAHDEEVSAIFGFGSFALGAAISGCLSVVLMFGISGLVFIASVSPFDVFGAILTCLLPYFLMKVAANMGHVSVSAILIGFLMEPVVSSLYEATVFGQLTVWGIVALVLVLFAAYLDQRSKLSG